MQVFAGNRIVTENQNKGVILLGLKNLQERQSELQPGRLQALE